METLRRKILTHDGYKFIQIYKTMGKLGTHGTTTFWLFEKPEVGKIIECIHDGGNGYVDDNSLMYQSIDRVRIDSIGSNNFIYTSRF